MYTPDQDFCKTDPHMESPATLGSRNYGPNIPSKTTLLSLKPFVPGQVRLTRLPERNHWLGTPTAGGGAEGWYGPMQKMRRLPVRHILNSSSRGDLPRRTL